MKNIVLIIFVSASIFAWVANGNGVTVKLIAEVGSSQFEGDINEMQVAAGDTYPLRVYKVVNGQQLDVTNSSSTRIETSSPERISLGDGNVSILPLPAGELVDSSDFVIGVLNISYYDEATLEYGTIPIFFEIR